MYCDLAVTERQEKVSVQMWSYFEAAMWKESVPYSSPTYTMLPRSNYSLYRQHHILGSFQLISFELTLNFSQAQNKPCPHSTGAGSSISSKREQDNYFPQLLVWMKSAISKRANEAQFSPMHHIIYGGTATAKSQYWTTQSTATTWAVPT